MSEIYHGRGGRTATVVAATFLLAAYAVRALRYEGGNHRDRCCGHVDRRTSHLARVVSVGDAH
ncbi:hypothetical protein FXN61_01665 [Lentzea sp. PSKA42]|uniref:Uncharacterized protein n=1 Tax=Lentzea indica TaxID=2604800 RepID=A0ABX1FA74_9PSEU|nr:hypothetical protein [Lentzea indica]NKE55601.1 hypothetical protein [Lentzea indica]